MLVDSCIRWLAGLVEELEWKVVPCYILHTRQTAVRETSEVDPRARVESVGKKTI